MNYVYWSSTIITTIFLLLSVYSYFFSEATINGLRDLGFPDFFRIQLAILKIIAIFGIIVPKVPSVLKEWSYAGVCFFLITALVAHIVHKDSIFISVLLVVLMLILGISYWSFSKV